MSTIIDADTAKLAGLQIDMLQKLRAGQMNLEQIEWFNHLQKAERGRITGIVLPDDRFEQIDEFTVVVPEGYDHTTHLDLFGKEHSQEFGCYNPNLTDKNFARVTTKLTFGRKFMVKVIQIKERVTSDDCLMHLKNQKAVLVGAQGVSLAYEQAKNRLPVSRWSVSFDKEEALPCVDGFLWVPSMNRDLADEFCFSLICFESALGGRHCLLCFCDLE